MTSPDPVTLPRFALLTNGSGFSHAVLEQLLEQALVPTLLVLPEYPPVENDDGIMQTSPPRTFRKLPADIELVYTPREWQNRLAKQIRRSSIDFILVVCWPYLIGRELRESPVQAALNLHPSRLPRYRGANPLQQQIAMSDVRAGVTLHLLSGKFDQGNIVDQCAFQVDNDQLNEACLEKRCAESGAGLFVKAIQSGKDSWQTIPQQDQALETD